LDGRVAIDDVRLIGFDPPVIDLHLDPAFDTGQPDDNLTNLAAVDLIGTTDPGQVVLIDVDGDGYDDGSATADQLGHYRIAGRPLTDGANTIRVQAANAQASAEAQVTIQRDSGPATGTLVAPAPAASRSRTWIRRDPMVGHGVADWTVPRSASPM